MDKKFTTITALVLVVVVGLFYWFAYRPSEIKKACYREARTVVDAISIDSNKEKYMDNYNNLYKLCVEKAGL